MKRKLIVGAAAGAAAILFAVTTSRADPNLTNIPKHRHYIKTPTGQLVEVGPRICENPDLQRAFNQFHNNIHAVSPAGIGPAAPGLHNHTGAEVVFVAGCP
jgi:hypothetical protein